MLSYTSESCFTPSSIRLIQDRYTGLLDAVGDLLIEPPSLDRLKVLAADETLLLV